MLRYLYPQADPLRDYVLGDEGLGDGPQIVAWTLDTPQPTPEELEAALPAAQARAADQAEMDEVGAELAERYSLHARALALRKAQTAQEIEEEAASLLAYQQEIRDRATTSPS
ncbi:XkdW family protein [Deinococcus sp. Leaf326]|uniref:XkdW family protein n=1 Tax=Deinococcus sp. Leaf326 TaxID=1736338 RepID=UPI00138EE360|nr:XkdW family protein [Deinococcus sp. Leaf326]